MSYRLTVKPAYLSDVLGLPRSLSRKVTRVLSELERNPFEVSNVKKLKGFTGLYRYRIDDYRMIYAVSTKARVVDLLAVGPRGDIYQRFQRTPDLPDAPLPETDFERDEVPQGVEEVEVPACEPVTRPTEGLPSFTVEDLAQWQIPERFFGDLLECRTDQDLFTSTVPDEWKERLLDRLYPKPIQVVQAQPTLLLQEPEDLQRYVEGDLSVFLLQLDAEQEALAARSLKGPALVKGGPGSGKSTVALYRVRALLKDGGNPRILFTTYTRALTSASEQLLQQLLGNRKEAVTVRTADSLALELVRGVDPAEEPERRRALRAARKKLEAPTDDLEAFLEAGSIAGLPDDYLLDEFDWVIEGQELDEPGYLACDRTGRGVPLDRSLRQRVWALYQEYRRLLERPTWGQIRAQALARVRQSGSPLPYDHVLIDEAQDLTPVALRLLISLCKSPEGIFLTADAGQSLYNRGFRWNRVHADLRLTGRTRLLRRNYRSTRAIGLAVSDLLRQPGDGADPETLDQEFIRDGEKPQVRLFSQNGQEFVWLAEELRSACRSLQLSVGAAAVLCPTRARAEEAANALMHQGLRAEFMDSRTLRLDAPAVKVLTMHAAKGLEFPLVALPGLEAGIMPTAPSPGDEPEVHDMAQRRLFHVAASRAMRRLYVTARKEKVSPYIRQLDPNHWNIVEES
ncbi:MAG: hypothetical protein AMXMBFR33_17630 [Candidatus Xenobia bacterium]